MIVIKKWIFMLQHCRWPWPAKHSHNQCEFGLFRKPVLLRWCHTWHLLVFH